jgi:hypothetical protein
MRGYRLGPACFREKVRLGIREIVDCLTPEISQLYCAAHGQFLELLASNDQESQTFDNEYAVFLLEELDSRELRLFRPGFLERFRDHLYGDWNSFYLLDVRSSFGSIQPWGNDLPAECKIFICCIDAAFWEVYSDDPGLLARLKERFNGAVGCLLQDKTV